jgi:hypothetical protein
MFFAIVLPGIVSLWGCLLVLRQALTRFTAAVKAEQVSRLSAAHELRHLPVAVPAIGRPHKTSEIGIRRARKASTTL